MIKIVKISELGQSNIRRVYDRVAVIHIRLKGAMLSIGHASLLHIIVDASDTVLASYYFINMFDDGE